MPSALFVGAHPDDIEIGAGGTLSRMLASNWKVAVCVLTAQRPATIAKCRQSEAVEAAGVLGLDPASVGFLGLPDTALIANGRTVAALRRHLGEARLDPDIVFTHSAADSHNDHRATAQIVQGALRGKAILGFPVVNSLNVSAYKPRIFTDVSRHHETKLRSLSCHRSQVNAGRIALGAVAAFDQATGNRLATSFAESFDATVQHGARPPTDLMAELNGCPFNKFWHNLVGDRTVVAVQGVVPAIADPNRHRVYAGHDEEASLALRQAFDERWTGPTPVRPYLATTKDADLLLRDHDVLLTGGPVTNALVRDLLNRLPGLRYVIEYDMPDFENPRIVDRQRGRIFSAACIPRAQQERFATCDLALLTILRNPYRADRWLINAGGLHGPGTIAAQRLLTDPCALQQLMRTIELPPPADVDGYQLLLSVDVQSGEAWIDLDAPTILRRRGDDRRMSISLVRHLPRSKSCAANVFRARKSTATTGCGYGATRSAGPTAATPS